MYVSYMLVAYLPFLYFSRELLTFIDMSTFIAKGYYDIAWKAVLGDLFDCIQMYLMEFCYSQRIESIFAPLTWINLVISVGLILLLDLRYGYSLDGWIIGRTTFYMLNSIAFFVVYITQTHKDSRGFCSLTTAMKNIREFVGDGITYSIGNMMEWISFETGIFFTGLTRDTNQIAALGSLMNLSYIMTDIGSGFLIIGRTRVNYLLGAGLTKASKKMAALALMSCIVPAIFLGLSLFFAKDYIALLYASNDLLEKENLVSLYSIYNFFTIIELSLYLLTALMRTANQVLFSSLAYLFIGVGGTTAICLYLYLTEQLNCKPIIMGMYATLASASIVCLVKLFTLNWNEIDIENADCSKLDSPADELK